MEQTTCTELQLRGCKFEHIWLECRPSGTRLCLTNLSEKHSVANIWNLYLLLSILKDTWHHCSSILNQQSIKMLVLDLRQL